MSNNGEILNKLRHNQLLELSLQFEDTEQHGKTLITFITYVKRIDIKLNVYYVYISITIQKYHHSGSFIGGLGFLKTFFSFYFSNVL